MKKVISLVILVAMTSSLFVGCQEPYDPNKLYTEPPSEAVFEEMYIALARNNYYVDLRNYPKTCPNSAWYYGTINGYIISSAITGDVQVMSAVCVADCVFEYGQPFNIFVYKDGEGCTLQEAYEQGWLTKEQIVKIHERYPLALEEKRQAKMTG